MNKFIDFDFDFVYRPQSNPSPFRPIQSPGAHTYQNVGSPVKPSPNINTPLKKLEHSNSTGNFVLYKYQIHTYSLIKAEYI